MGRKAVTAFASASSKHGDNESTILAFYNTMDHGGAIIVPPGYTHPAVYAAAGNPLRHRPPLLLEPGQ